MGNILVLPQTLLYAKDALAKSQNIEEVTRFFTMIDAYDASELRSIFMDGDQKICMGIDTENAPAGVGNTVCLLNGIVKPAPLLNQPIS